MTEPLCFACSDMQSIVRDSLIATGLRRDETELRLTRLLDRNWHVRACAAMSLVLATDDYLICALLEEHSGEHAVRVPVTDAVRLLTIASVAEQLTGAIDHGDFEAARLATDLLSELFDADGPTNGMLR